MSKSVEVSKTSGAFHFKDKGHEKSKHPQGAHDQGKHEKPAKAEGLHQTGKPIVHVESDTQHSGRLHPPATKLADSKVLRAS